jgi:hypothetical protein
MAELRPQRGETANEPKKNKRIAVSGSASGVACSTPHGLPLVAQSLWTGTLHTKTNTFLLVYGLPITVTKDQKQFQSF